MPKLTIKDIITNVEIDSGLVKTSTAAIDRGLIIGGSTTNAHITSDGSIAVIEGGTPDHRFEFNSVSSDMWLDSGGRFCVTSGTASLFYGQVDNKRTNLPTNTGLAIIITLSQRLNFGGPTNTFGLGTPA